jgi:hypothetical protein
MVKKAEEPRWRTCASSHSRRLKVLEKANDIDGRNIFVSSIHDLFIGEVQDLVKGNKARRQRRCILRDWEGTLGAVHFGGRVLDPMPKRGQL